MRLSCPKTASLIIGLSVLCLNFAFADYHYASHSGSNTYPYTSWATATDSVNAAVDAADPGDTVYIASGDYKGLVIMYPADSLIAIIGAGMDSTYLFTHEQHCLIYAGPKLYLKCLKFYTEWGFDAIWAAAAGRDVTIENCHFIGDGAGIWTSSSNIIIRNCLFENMQYPGVEGESSVNQSLELSNCIFRHMYNDPVKIFSLHAVLKNNIVTTYWGEAAFHLLYASAGYVYISNNIIHHLNGAALDVAIYDTSSRINNNVINDAYSCISSNLFGQNVS